MNLHGLDAIIFDFDGVLVESVEVKTRAFAALYADRGSKIVEQVKDFHLRHGGVSRFDKFRYFQTEILGGAPLNESEVADLAATFSTLVVDEVVAAPMVAGAQQFLESCSGKVLLFVVSGTPTGELDDILRRRKMAAHFSGFWGSPQSKAQNISELLGNHDLSASRCVMIGDSIADLEGAAANSVHFLGRVAKNDENPFSNDIVIFRDFTDLPASWDAR